MKISGISRTPKLGEIGGDSRQCVIIFHFPSVEHSGFNTRELKNKCNYCGLGRLTKLKLNTLVGIQSFENSKLCYKIVMEIWVSKISNLLVETD